MPFKVTYKKDFKDVDVRERPDLLPPGEYLVEVQNVSRKATIQASEPGENAWLTLRVFEAKEGDYEGSIIIDNISLKESAQWRVKQYFVACTGRSDFSGTEVDFEETLGSKVVVLTENRSYKGVERTRVKNYYPISRWREEEKKEEEVSPEEEVTI